MRPGDLWYSHGPLASHNGLINFTIGGRGTGKTFDYKRWALTKGTQTVWIRRSAEDVKEFKSKFFPDLIAENVIQEDDEYRIKGDTLTFNGQEKIFFLALSVGRRYKSSSFNNVGHVFFDEFIDETNRYLDRELDRFASVYETINRLRIDRPEARVFFIGNKVNFQNPYFSFWKIRPFEGRFKRFNNGTVIVENYFNPIYERLKKSTRSYQAFQGSSYTRAMVDNTSWLDSNAFISKRDPKAVLYANVRFRDVTFGIWTTKSPRAIYCSRAHNKEAPSFAPAFSCEDDELPLTGKSAPMELLSIAHESSLLFFDDNEIKDIAISLLQGGYKR